MNCNEIEKLLADYLGNELGESDRERFDSHLESCSSCRSELTGLEATIAKLEVLETMSVDLAKLRTSQLEVRRKVSWSRRLSLGGLRYAAMLIIGVSIGLYINISPASTPITSPAGYSPLGRISVPEDLHPDWVQAALKADGHYGSPSSFVRCLALLSQIKKGK